MSDPRFARLKSDPRFRRPRKQKSKVVVDERFESVFAPEKKPGNKGKSGRVDKYGRPQAASKEQDDLRRYYRLDAKDDESAGEDAKAPDYARGAVLLESSDEEEEGDQSDGGSSDADEFVTVGGDHTRSRRPAPNDGEVEIDLDESELADLDAQAAAYQKTNPEAASEGADQTRRLAIVNLDWDHVRASHLFKICSSLVSPSAPALASSSRGRTAPAKGKTSQVARGRVLSVRVYPSQFGKERLAREETEGPPAEIFKKRRDEDNDEEANEQNIYEVGDEEEHDEDALRNYQLERLRYYYAIVDCDTVDAAVHIYTELEGTELERSANVFDLSFVPDDMTFDDEHRDEATVDPNTTFKAVDFVTDALRHSKVKLTWDEDDPERNHITRRKLTQAEIDEADFRTYLASSSSESESDTDIKRKKKGASRDKLRSLLLGGGDNDLPEGWGRDEDGDDVDMEITFTPGLAESKGEEDETTLEKYQRKMKEKRRQRKDEVKEQATRMKDSGLGDEDDFFEAESDEENKKTKQSKKASKRQPEVVREASPAVEEQEDLSHVIATEDPSAPKHFSMKSVIKAEKAGKRKGKKKPKKTDAEENETQEDFSIDATDDRFKAIHDDYNFAIDPSNPHFKKTKGMSVLLEERSKRQRSKKPAEAVDTAKPSPNGGTSSLKSLVDSVKRKSAPQDKSGPDKRRKLV